MYFPLLTTTTTLLALTHTTAASKLPVNFTLTAIYTNEHNNSAFQCWQLAAPFITSTVPGTPSSILSLGNFSDAGYVVSPPRSVGGPYHNAPRNQILVWIAGEGNFTLPYSDEYAEVKPNKNGVVIATDVTGTGHRTNSPSDRWTESIELPLPFGELPEHTVLHEGVCVGDEVEYK